MYDLLLWEKISFIRSCDMEEIKATDCIIKVHITSGNIKWCSFALGFCASNHKERMTTSASLCEGHILYFYLLYCKRVTVIFTLPFLHFILWLAQYVGKILVYMANWMWVFMNYYCWHYPWGKMLGGKTISPYLSLCPIKTPYS